MRLVTRLMRLLKSMSGCRRQGCVDPVSLVCTFKRFQRSVEKYNKIYRVQRLLEEKQKSLCHKRQREKKKFYEIF